MTEQPTRRDLLKPVQLLGIAFACAIFAGGVTLVTGGAFQTGVGLAAVPLAAVVGGITFIVVLLGLSLLLLAVDPRQVTRQIDRGVLIDDEATPPPPPPATAPGDDEDASRRDTP